MSDEELYGDAEEDVQEKASKPMMIINKSLPPAPASKIDPKASVLKPTESSGTISVKERLAMLQANNVSTYLPAATCLLYSMNVQW